MNSRLLCGLTLLALGLLLGCNRFGSATVPVQLNSNPSGGWAYLIPIDKWSEVTGRKTHDMLTAPVPADQMQRIQPRIAQYKVTVSRTPTALRALPHKMIYIVEHEGKWGNPMIIRPGDQETFNTELP